MTVIGTVEILRDRVYPFNPDDTERTGASIYVPVGSYPLHFDGGTYYWTMSGHVNTPPGFRSLGDGMFMLQQGDDPSGHEVSFTSKRFTQAQFDDLLAEDGFTDGHPEQRLRVRLTSQAVL